MSQREEAAGVGARGGEARLRKPERRQMGWVPQWPDDLISPTHEVRTVAAVMEKLDVSGFAEAIRSPGGAKDCSPPRHTRCFCAMPERWEQMRREELPLAVFGNPVRVALKNPRAFFQTPILCVLEPVK